MQLLHRLLAPFRSSRTPSLYWLTPELAFAPAPAAADWPRLAETSLRSVLDLRAESPDAGVLAAANRLAYLRLPITEGAAPTPAQLTEAAEWVRRRLADGAVLVCCREGRGRSPLVACAALVKLGWPLADAYRAATRARPDIRLNPSQTEALRRFATDLTKEP